MLYLQITNNGDKNDMVSQMAHAKNLGEPFMAHLENLYNIPCLPISFFLTILLYICNYLIIVSMLRMQMQGCNDNE